MVFSGTGEHKQPQNNHIVANNKYTKKNTTNVDTQKETVYYMQNSMIGRLLNNKKCRSCPRS